MTGGGPLADSERTQIGEERFKEANLRAVLNLRGENKGFQSVSLFQCSPNKLNHDGRRNPSQIQSERGLGKNGSKKLICEPF